jgi:apolipoprotein D and lipocalin family protein
MTTPTSASLTRAALLLALAASSTRADQCPHPRAAANYANVTGGFTGTWFEIGKAQTWGGAIFESSCVCTQLIASPANDGTPSDVSVLNSCRTHTPQGSFENATGTLVNEREPGAWEEEFIPGLPTVNYTVIALSDDYSVEFDCGETFGVVNYCIHILSRTSTMDPATYASLVALANDTLGLNIYNLPYNLTKQEGCW